MREPGAGPVLVAGSSVAWILATLEGAGGGAVLGGLVGGVAGHFVSDKRIPRYENHLKSGKYLLIAHGEQDVRRPGAEGARRHGRIRSRAEPLLSSRVSLPIEASRKGERRWQPTHRCGWEWSG
jgi:hypothetical protein